MRTEYQEYNGPVPVSETPQESSPVAQEIEHLQESVERSESEARRTRSKVEQHEQEH